MLLSIELLCVMTVSVYSNVRFQFRDTASQHMFTSLQIITEGARMHIHTHTLLS